MYLDYFSAMTDDAGLLRTELSDDDLHPNGKGYAIKGPLMEAALARAEVAEARLLPRREAVRRIFARVMNPDGPRDLRPARPPVFG